MKLVMHEERPSDDELDKDDSEKQEQQFDDAGLPGGKS